MPRPQARIKQITLAQPREYTGSDGRRKSTLEEAFTVSNSDLSESSTSSGRPPPWAIGWQTAENSVEWNDDLKNRIITVIALLS